MKKTLLFAAAALTMLASCSQSDDLNNAPVVAESQNNAIEFGTYVGKGTTTRSGYEGSIDNAALQNAGKANGFGVFAYYTGLNTYAKAQTGTYTSEGGSGNVKPNFMFNQHVTYSTDHWTYEPLKYWPNEISNSDIDDQNNDANDNPAWGSNNGTLTNGGNVTFFAYAPYVQITSGLDATTINGATPAGTTDGIVALSGNGYQGDPYISYKVAADGNVVDLLWGTASGTSTNVNNANNSGVTGTTSTSPQPEATITTYAGELLKGYTTNADLTKQRTDGKVGFAFKHALAKIGGSNITGASGSTVNGLMVVLDLDDNGAERGGSRESFTTSASAAAWRTIVTVNSITITNDLDGDGSISSSGTKGDEQMINGGKFNLATGKWTLDAKGDNKFVHSITTGSAVEGSNAASLANAIKETGSPTASSEESFFLKSNTHTGVTETPQNVYQDETNPLVFIPGTTPTLRFTIDYYVRTYDGNLATKYSEVRQVISKKVTFTTLELNKQYNMLIHLGLTGVKFTATVSDWSVGGDDNNNGVLDGEENLDVKDIYLPINVSSLLVTYSATPTTKFASTAASANAFTVSTAKFYDGNEEQSVAPSALTLTASPAASWMTLTAPSAVVNTANTTFATRSTTISITKSPYICDNPVTITQYGRIPSDDATITLTTASFTTVDNTAHDNVAFSVTSATIDKYFETDATGGKTGAEQSSSATLTNGKDINFSKPLFLDAYGNEVSWITLGSGDNEYTISANGTSSARTATVAYVVNGKVVKTNKTITQNA